MVEHRSRFLAKISLDENILSQNSSKLLKIPSAIFIEIIIYIIESGIELLEICLTCKKVLHLFFNDPRPWLSLVLQNFRNKIIPKSQIVEYQNMLNNGYKDTSEDWRSFYIKNCQKKIVLDNQPKIDLLARKFPYFPDRTTRDMIRDLNIKFYAHYGKRIERIKRESIKTFEIGLRITIKHMTPVVKPSSISLYLYGIEIFFTPQFKEIAQKKRASFYISKSMLGFRMNSEILTENWFFSIYEIFSRLTKYENLRIHFFSSSAKKKCEPSHLNLELHNLRTKIIHFNSRQLDFYPYENKSFAFIQNLNLKIPKSKLEFGFKHSNIFEKIENICIVDFALFTENKKLIFWGSEIFQVKKACNIKVIQNNCSIELFLTDEENFFILHSIIIEVIYFPIV